jgi:hypothetical protein
VSFDAYEYVGVIIPGALPTLTVSLLIPEVASVVRSEGVELGTLGIFLIMSFVVGHVVQLIGNWIEIIEDSIGWGKDALVLNEKRRPIDIGRWQQFLSALRSKGITDADELSSNSWQGIRKEVYAALQADKRTQRIDAFNRTYGMCRGMVAGTILTIGLILALGGTEHQSKALLTFGLLTIPLYIRMRRFSRHYFTEIVFQYLALSSSDR